MTEPTTTPEDTAGTAPTAEPAAAPSTVQAPPAAIPRARRWSTLTVAVAGGVALVLGLGIGGASGWAFAHAQHPGFAGAEFRGDDRFHGRDELPGHGDDRGHEGGQRGDRDGGTPQRGDDDDPGDDAGS